MVAKREEEGLKSPFERNDDILREIGRIVSIWGTINNLLRTIASTRLKIEEDKADLVLNSFSGEEAKLRFLIGLVESQSLKEDEQLLKCLAKLKDLSAERNLIVHGGPLRATGLLLRGDYFVNFRKTDDERYTEALPFMERHLLKLRKHGATLYDLALDATYAVSKDDEGFVSRMSGVLRKSGSFPKKV